MSGPAPLALAWIMIHAAAGSLNVADAARVQARRADIGDGTWIDFHNTPRLSLARAWPTTQFDAGYAPRLLWLDIGGDNASPTLVLHTAALQISFQQPRYTLSLSQTGVFGDQDYAQLGLADPTLVAPVSPLPGGPMIMPTLDAVPRVQVLEVASEETIADLRYDWSRRLSSSFGASFGFSGGADAAAQQVLPRQRTAMVDAALDYRASRRDLLSTGLDLAQIHTSNGYDHFWISLMESWGTTWAASSGGELGAGVAVQHTNGPAGLDTTDTVPVGTASVWYTMLEQGMEVRFQWGLDYAPYVDVLAGTLQSRLATSAQVALTVDRSSVRSSIGAAQTFPVDDPDATTLLSADLMFEQELLDWLIAQLGGQIVWQSSDGNPLALEGSRWLVYAGLEGRVPEVRF